MVGGKDSRHRCLSRYLPIMFSPVVSLRTTTIGIPPGKQISFISDVHLGFGPRNEDVRRERKLLSLIDKIADSTSHLVIVGDLFDYWFDYKTVIPKHHIRTIARLMELIDAGVHITYLIGNHDFGHWKYFHEELGIEVDTGDVDATIAGTRFYLSHGDGKAANDKGYLVLRSVLRNRLAQWMYRKIHPNLGIRLASGTSHGSREYTGAKDFGTEDGLKHFASQKIAEGYDIVVMGHRHRVAYEKMGSGLYVNLGDWLGEDPHYGRFTVENGMELVKL